jgi:hypothetical protein
MAQVINIRPVVELIHTYDKEGNKVVTEKRYCVKVENWTDFDIAYDGDGNKVLERRN